MQGKKQKIISHLKESGQKRVLANADAAMPSWSTIAVNTIALLAKMRGSITSDDLRGALPAAPHHNAIGAAFSAASRQGLIMRVGFRQALHKSAHGRVVSVWAEAV